MMKMLWRIVLIGLIFILGTLSAFAGEEITLELDGETIVTDVAPLIENERTLIPYRALLEAMGGEVSWNQEAQMASATLGSQKVQVTIDNTTGFVNGGIQVMDVPPRIVNNRTLIPLRFVLENLNCSVDWNPDTRTVLINSPQDQSTALISNISIQELENSFRIMAESSEELTSITSFAYQDPERFGIDIHNAVLPEGVGSLVADNDVFQKVRYSQLDEDTVRIVVDLNAKVAGKISLSKERTSIYIDFDLPENADDSVSEEETDAEEPAILPTLDWRVSGKLIAIDPGHGGKDPGAEGILDGRHAVWEKDLNLPIALRVHELLTEAGANAMLLRDTDVYMGLYARPEAANMMNADLLVGIHNNSGETATSRGTEILYYTKEGEESYGLASKDVATMVQKEIVAEIGLPDRGIHSRPQLAVLNKSLMPAIIIEGGFLSNREDLSVMLTEDFLEDYAIGVARGIINVLNASVEE